MPERELSEIERALKRRHNPTNLRFQSTAGEPKRSEDVNGLVLADVDRGRMPLTQEKFVLNENPARVEWERQLRKFVRRLNTRDSAHRITAPMIFEWATGLSIKELAQQEGVADKDPRGGGNTGSANMHLRHLNALLRDYFGKSYKTQIAGRSVGKAYKVNQHFRIENTRPKCLTLWPEWENGTLNP
ncbi:hypothetical protein SEA_ALOEVERA_1 [Microbacterium phage AloeVera]|uniref:Uncharacterized protein n=3 Tax=Akonivirus akoni TaxID=2845587 RepID=A0A6M3TA30_9CAUD|nr:hypothetical protein HWC17_gp01 [Microbacterium phage Akoni]QCG78288.1 hypothetical protein SEA_AKONI_1 [Microbacterium phage Akoni]QJD51251.1 hypothetical protein SEA_TRUONG_1 [Microbacterium phage Truong]QJD51741.1 hypothetical protein SEA_ASHTON_1 [Microbacterium phage Ashton]